jgi:hypothetical protein
MADYSAAASAASDAIADAAEGLIEEYEIRANGRRVKRGRIPDQIKAAALLEGLASRRGGRAICSLSKPANPR